MPRRRREYYFNGYDSDDDNIVGNSYSFSTSSSSHAARLAQEREATAKLEEGLEGLAENEETAEVWRQYECKSLSFGIPHPGDIVEAASLSAVSLPAHSYPLEASLSRQISEGTLSSMQLEGVLYACERHSRYLPDGRRAGFFVGDSAGVGKGRQMAGIILDNLLRGRKRHVWFSASKDLHIDATRDLRDIGCTVQVFESISALGRRMKAQNIEEAVVFCTYNELTSSGSRRTMISRFEELVRWLCNGSVDVDAKKAYEGVVVFDECHKAKNYFEGKAEKNSTKAGISVVQLQEQLPNARIVYSSATGISAVENMGYMSRMGLWGEKTSFKTFADFSTAIGGGKSVAALEMLALEFKATGCQVARNVGYHGAEFSTVSANLSPDDARMYRAAAELWRDVLEAVNKANELCKKTPKNDNRPWRASSLKGFEGNSVKMFWSFHQRFMRQLIASLKIPALAHVANEALKAGYCVVIGLQTTGEAALGRALQDELDEYGVSNAAEVIEEDEEEDGEENVNGQNGRKPSGTRRVGKNGQLLTSQNGELVSVCRSILKSFLVNWFPTKQTWVPLPEDPKEIPYLPDRSDMFIELWLICRDVPQLDSKMFIPKIMQYLFRPQTEIRNNPGDVPAYDRDGTVVECQRMKSRLLARLNNIYLPPCALDDLIDRLGGVNEVAEMTGRTLRQVRLEDGSVMVQSRVRASKRGKRSTDDLTSWGDTAKASLNVQERGAFMHGKKLVAIISEAASTGISLHADRTALNQRRRVHCTLELPWAADQAIQQLGRSHRTNQSSAPIFRLLSSGLGGEHRFISSVSRRLQSLGALTQGDRRASVGAMTFGEFQFESDHGRNALKVLYDSIMGRRLPPNTDWLDIVAQSKEHLKLDFGYGADDEVPEIAPQVSSQQPSVNIADKKKKKLDRTPAPWCPPAFPNMKTEDEFFDALEEAAKFTGSLKFTTELEDPSAGYRGKRRAVNAMGLAPVFFGQPIPPLKTTPGRRRLVPIDTKTFNQTIAKDVPRFFNRILGLPFGQQALLFNYFSSLLEEDIKEAKRNGKYDRGVQILDGQNISRVRPPELIYRDPGTGGKLMVHALIRDRGVQFKDIIRELRYRNATLYNPLVKREDFPLVDPPTPQSLAVALNEAGDNGHFFRSNKEIFGRMRTCLAIRLGTSQWKIIRPGTGIFSASQMADDTLRKNYHIVTNFEKLQRFWQDEFEWTEKECTHGPNCKHGSLCTVGRRKFETNILTGNVISLWSSLEGIISNIQTLPRSERTMSIVQTNVTDTRERVVGVIWPVAAVPSLRNMVKDLQDKHDSQRRSVVIRNLPVMHFLERPNPAIMNTFEGRERYFTLDLQYQTWSRVRFVPDDQLKVLGFSLNNQGVVDKVTQVALDKGIQVGYTLFRVGYSRVEPESIQGELKLMIISSTRTMANKEKVLQEVVFLRPRTAKDEEDDERLWREGLAREPAAEVDPKALARLVTDPKLLRPKVEEEAMLLMASRDEDTPPPAKAVRAGSKKRRVSPVPDDGFDDDEDGLSKNNEDEEEDISFPPVESNRSTPASSSTMGRSSSRQKARVDYTKFDEGTEDEEEADADNGRTMDLQETGDVEENEEM